MDTTARRRKIQKIVEDRESNFYNHDVSMYKEEPANAISLTEFEDLAMERLQLLRTVEQASLKGHKIFSEDWKKCIREDLSKNGLKKYIRLLSGLNSNSENDIQARRDDYLSHYILCLAYCRSEELRKWFISKELEWFKLKFQSQNQQGILSFFKKYNLTYSPISSEQKEKIKNELIMATPGLSDIACEATDFYKVDFTEVLPLVKNRRCYLHKCYAYIPTSDLIICVQAKFRANLSEVLNIYNRRLPYLDDDRLNSLLSNLHNMYTGKAFTVEADKEGIDPAKLDSYSKQHFPLCMRHLHEVLRSQHHLKHMGRLTYGLFLKGIGLSYDDAMEFWRQEFTKNMDNEKFVKQYAYNFKHQFGKAGRMVSYSPYSCVKIITGSVGTGDCHGCPFKHWDPTIIKQKLVEHGVGSEGVSSILELATNGHYQIACSKYFECVHNQPPSMSISHPNQYFQESSNLRKDKQQKKI